MTNVNTPINAYPLRFTPECKQRIWGGHALDQFNITLPPGKIGEAWMISDHPNGITPIENGALKGTDLSYIRTHFATTWLGTRCDANETARFPLLIKLLDCNDDLSVQVHPNDTYTYLPAGERGKTEMWYVLSATHDAKIIYGLKSQVTREQLTAAMTNNELLDCLQEVSVSAGDAFYIPAGTVHALCAGVIVAEVQQNSDTTYRLYDYNRLGLNGELRELHIEDSLRVINYDNAGIQHVPSVAYPKCQWLPLATSDYFIVEKGMLSGSQHWRLTTTKETFTIIIICDGDGTLSWQDGTTAIKKGECYLLPACLGNYTLKGDCTLLRAYLPF